MAKSRLDLPPAQVRYRQSSVSLWVSHDLLSARRQVLRGVPGRGRAATNGSRCSKGITWRSSGSVATARRHHPGALRRSCLYQCASTGCCSLMSSAATGQRRPQSRASGAESSSSPASTPQASWRDVPAPSVCAVPEELQIWTNAASIAAPQAAQDGPRPTL